VISSGLYCIVLLLTSILYEEQYNKFNINIQ